MSGFTGLLLAGKGSVTFVVGVQEITVVGIHGYVAGQQGTLSPTSYYSLAVKAAANIAPPSGIDFGLNIQATGVQLLFRQLEIQDSAGGTRILTANTAVFTANAATVDGVLCDNWAWGDGNNRVWTAEHVSRQLVIR